MNAFKNINKTSRSKRTDQSTAHSRQMRTTQISGVSDTFMAGNMAQNAFKVTTKDSRYRQYTRGSRSVTSDVPMNTK